VQLLRQVTPQVLVAGLVVVLCLPLLVALGVLHDPRPFPLGDLAMIELRVRDVGWSHPPLLGLPGRITGEGLPGSHPGPLAFYALAPVYRLLRGTAWGLHVSAVVLGIVAVALMLWMVWRRSPARDGARPTKWPVLGMAAVLALLLRAYGPHLLTEPWNPFMPILWWTVFLVAVWGVLDDDLALLPVAVFAGCFCMQTHISYLGLVPVLGLVMAVVLGRRLWERHRNPVDRQRMLRWIGWSSALGVVLWLPPVVDELANSPGNMAIIVDNFRHPSSREIGAGTAFELWTERLDPRGLITGNLPGAGAPTIVAALALLGAWAATAVLVVRRSRRIGSVTDPGRDDPATLDTLVRLHLVVAIALAAGMMSLTRIFGIPWYYLHLWGWGTSALLLLATGWSAAVLLRTTSFLRSVTATRYHSGEAATQGGRVGSGGGWRPRTTSRSQNGWRTLAGAAVLGGIVVASTVAFAVDAADTDTPAVRMTAALRAVTPEAVDALTAEDAVGGGRDGRYLVHWNDPVGIGDQGWGLLDELERQGLDVYVEPAPDEATLSDPRLAVDRGARAHRVLDPDDASGIVTLAVGPRIDAMRQLPDAVELAYDEPRTPAEQARYAELRGVVDQELVTCGLTGKVDPDGSLFALAQRPELTMRAQIALAEMQHLGLPVAIFVQPA
jgi:hypothetical protein